MLRQIKLRIWTSLTKLEVCKRQTLLNYWRIRNLSILGRVTINKALAISQLVHLFSSLPTPRLETMSKIKRMLFKFLWNDKNDKIRRTKICQPYQSEGVKMVDVDIFVASLKCSWIKRLQYNSSDETKWVAWSRRSLHQHGDNLSWYGATMLRKLANKTCNSFWADVLNAWAKFTEYYVHKSESITNEAIWCNDILKYNYSMNRNWRSEGLFFVSDLLKDNKLMSQAEIEAKYGVRVNAIDYNSIRLKVVQVLGLIGNRKDNNPLPAIPPRTHLVMDSKNLSQVVSQTLLGRLNTKNDDIGEKIKHKWLRENQIYQSGTLVVMRQISHSTSLQSLHYRLVNRTLPTNIFLFRVGCSDTSQCTFCDSAEETLGHLFASCEKVRAFFSAIQSLLRQKYSFSVTIEHMNRIFPDASKRRIFGLIAVIARQCIWFAKLDKRKPEVRHFENALRRHYFIERYSSKMNNTYELWQVKWDGPHGIE